MPSNCILVRTQLIVVYSVFVLGNCYTTHHKLGSLVGNTSYYWSGDKYVSTLDLWLLGQVRAKFAVLLGE